MQQQVNVVKTINETDAKVWQLISAINGLERWFSIITQCDVQGAGIGAVRTLELKGGAKMIDTVIEINQQQQCFRYVRTEMPFPVTDYHGTVMVRKIDAQKTEITWLAEYVVADAQQAAMYTLISDTLTEGLNGLAQELAGEVL
ncbi:MAG: mxaD protein [Methyloprofundus sp.]|nr:MAG: mxaD protein [Methyloprofundus sp.]